jgi:hypothetical protein
MLTPRNDLLEAHSIPPGKWLGTAARGIAMPDSSTE